MLFDMKCRLAETAYNNGFAFIRVIRGQPFRFSLLPPMDGFA
jgi:hypothetical protein